MTSEAALSPDPTGYIRIRTPDDPHGWTAEGDLMPGHPYLYSSGDVAVEVTWAVAPSPDPEALRAFFRERGWSIAMEDNEHAVLDPFLSRYGSLASTGAAGVTPMQRFKEENPEWADLPDEAVEKSGAFARWQLGEALDDLGRTLLEEARRIPLVGRLFR